MALTGASVKLVYTIPHYRDPSAHLPLDPASHKVLIRLPLFASQASRSNLYLKAYMPVAGDDGTCGNG